MMPPDNTPPPSKNDQENSDGKKITTKPTPEHGIKCPRCDSPNTKFCYYNNYSLTQPRHFCKTCRRYWTNGGALRNVPIGGGCRKKNKKVKTSSSSSTSSLSILSYDSNKDSASSSSSSSQFRFFHGLNSPSLEFQLGGLLPFQHHLHQPSFTTGIYNNQFSSIGEVSNSNTLSASSFQLDPSGGGGSSNSLMGLNYPLSGLFNGGNAIQGMNLNSSLASSIESLSSINQDLHLKLQQQRLATMFGGDNVNQKEEGSSSVSLSPVNIENLQTLKPQPLLFQNLEISKPEMVQGGNNSRKEGTSGDAPPTMEWFFGNSNYCSVSTPAATTNGSVGNDHDNANNIWSNGVHGWGNVQQPYSALP